MLRASLVLASTLLRSSRAFTARRAAPQITARRAAPTRMASAPALFDPTPFYATAQPPETKDFMMQQVMWGFSVYFVAHGLAGPVPEDEDARWRYCMTTPGCVELTWNHGSEAADGAVYNTGNSDATGSGDGGKVKGGFGHLGITVPDVYDACERFKALGATFSKTPNSGGMKGLAFVKDPDGYLIEVLPQGPMLTKPVDCDGVAVDGGEYKDNSK
ncbi:lactoylglutathione lyase [Aureococcus anophagefferens]|nr:lactoylglutathione lyase [Aureococcus anophagefferens]